MEDESVTFSNGESREQVEGFTKDFLAANYARNIGLSTPNSRQLVKGRKKSQHLKNSSYSFNIHMQYPRKLSHYFSASLGVVVIIMARFME